MKKIILNLGGFALMVTSVFTSCSKAPSSSFTASPSTVWVGQSVTIKNGVDSKDNNIEYYYDFGDGTQSAPPSQNNFGVSSPSHVYQQVGVYTITQQIIQSSNVTKGSGSGSSSSQTVTVKMVTPILAVSVAAPNSGQAIQIINNTVDSVNLGTPASYSVSISGPGGYTDNNLSGGTGAAHTNISWTPPSAGTYIITLTAQQGLSQKSVSTTVTVGGVNSTASTNLSNMFNGTWTTTVSTSFTGYNTSGVGTCTAPTAAASNYSSMSISNNGGNPTVYAAVQATGATAGDIVATPGISFTISADGSYVTVAGATTLFTGASVGFSSPNGIYAVTSASPTSIVLTRVYKNTTNCNPGTGVVAYNYTDTYVITLTQ